MSERNRLLVLFAATAGAIMVPLNTSMLSVGLAPIMNDFHVSVSATTWLVLLYLVVITSMQPMAGKLGDRYGHRTVFLLALVLFGLASLGAATAASFPVLVLFRVLQGLTSSALGPNAAALIRLAYPLEHQGKAMGLYVGTFSMGLTMGPVISGLLVSSLGWRGIFWINVPAVAMALWLGARVLPPSPGGVRTPFDWSGTTVFTALIGGTVVALNLWKGGTLPIPLWTVLPVAAVLAVLLYRLEERAPDPLIRFGLFRLPGFGASNLAIFLLHSMVYIMLVAVPLYLQEGRGLHPATSGVLMAVFSLMQVLVAPIAGRLSDRFGRRIPVVAGGLLYLATALAFMGLSEVTPVWLLAASLVMAGIGTGLTGAPVQATALAACPPDDVGVGSGVWYSARYLGNICGALMSGLLLPARLGGGAPVLYGTMAVVALALAASTGLLPRAAAIPTS
ncbi:MAG TPA: MFS transporter [Symbiobacteriaceae bacterium]|nr:MFS transporter [Symbiobacteriaceae bacterium]